MNITDIIVLMLLSILAVKCMIKIFSKNKSGCCKGCSACGGCVSQPDLKCIKEHKANFND